VQGEGGCSLRPGQGTLLALRPLATVQLGVLATTGAAELPPLRGGVLLVAQPQEHRLQRLRYANDEALTGCRKVQDNTRKRYGSGGVSKYLGTKQAPKTRSLYLFLTRVRRLHNPPKSLPRKEEPSA
jgi:hypothetical protein